LDIPVYKIASTDLNNLPLLDHIAKKGRPMILSTAMSNMDEVIESINQIRKTGINDIAVLQCTGNYPAKLEDSNLLVMNSYREKLNCLVGYSDHTPSLINPVAATALGADIYEKHFTIDKKLPGPDHRMSLEPAELQQTIRAIRSTELALGSRDKVVLDDEKENRTKLRKSIVAIDNIMEGEVIQRSMIDIKRPGSGLEPKYIFSIVGKRANTFIEKDTTISKNQVS